MGDLATAETRLRVLVLDDCPARHDRFRGDLMGHDVTHVRLFSVYLKLIRGTRFDVVFLDHDLADMVDQDKVPGMYGGGRPYDGTDAAVELGALPKDRWPKIVFVHSWNGHGAKTMANILATAGHSDVRVIQYGRDLTRAIIGLERGMAAKTGG